MATRKSVGLAILDLTIIAAVLVAVFPQFVFTSSVMYPPAYMSDIIIQEMGISRFTGEELAAGRLPLWNPYVFMGYPHMAMGYSSVFYPSSIIYGLGSFPYIYKFDFLVHVFAGAAFMYWLGRRMYTTRLASLCCAVYFIFATTYFKSAIEGHLAYFHVLTYIPLGLLCLASVLRGGSMVWALLWTVVLCVQIFAGYFQLLVYELLVFGVFCAVELIRQLLARNDSMQTVLRRAAVLLLSTALGIACASVLLVPALELLSTESVRGHGVSERFSMLGSFGLWDVILSEFRWDDAHERGRVVSMAFLTAFGAYGLLRGRSPLLVAALVAGAVAFVISLGADTPLFDNVKKIPIIGSLRAMTRMFQMVVVMLIFLGGFGIDSLAGAKDSGRRRWIWLSIFGAILVAQGVLPLVYGFHFLNAYFMLYALVCALFLVIIFSPAAPRSLIATAIVGGLVFDFSGATVGRLPRVGNPEHYRLSRDWEAISKRHEGFDRFLILARGMYFMTILNPQLGSLSRERTVNGYGGLELRRYTELFERSLGVPRVSWNADGAYDGEAVVPETWLVSSHQLQALGAFNVRYYVSAQPGAPLLDTLAKRSDSVSRFEMTDVIVYQNKVASSPAYILHKSAYDPENAGRFDSGLEAFRVVETVYENGAKMFEASVAPVEQVPGHVSYPYDVAVLEEEIPLQLGEPAGAERAEIEFYEPRRVEIATTVTAPGILVLTDMYYPGWRCVVNGEREERVFAVNNAARGVQVLPGDTSVVFTFEPRSFQIGLMLSLGAVSALVAWAVAVVLWRRRASARGKHGDAAQGPAGDPQDAVPEEA